MARHKIFFYMFTGIFWIFSPPAWPQQTQCLQYHTARETRSIVDFGLVTLELAQEQPPRVSSPEFTKEQSLFSAGRFPWLKKGSFGSPWTAPTPTGLMTGCILTPRGFNIYLLQNEKMDYPTARTKALSELVLQEKPWIASGDIERYDVSTHLIHLTKGITVTWKRISSEGIPFQVVAAADGERRISIRGTPFVAAADGQRCYLGMLWPSLPGAVWPGDGIIPLIQFSSFRDETPDLVPLGVFSFVQNYQLAEDPRFDPRLIKALKENGQYHAGVECSLNEAVIIPTPEGSSVRYTYTLKNNDQDDLYVLDPNRMNTDYFHSNQNGIQVIAQLRVDEKSGLRSNVFRPDDRVFARPTPRKGVDKEWFTRLPSGELLRRTAIIKGFPRIPSGEYRLRFYFASPGYGHGAIGWITRDQRQLKDGRIWIGQIRVDLTTVVQAEGGGWDEAEDKIKKAAVFLQKLGNPPNTEI